MRSLPFENDPARRTAMLTDMAAAMLTAFRRAEDEGVETVLQDFPDADAFAGRSVFWQDAGSGMFAEGVDRGSTPMAAFGWKPKRASFFWAGNLPRQCRWRLDVTVLLVDLGNTALKWSVLGSEEEPKTVVHRAQSHFKRISTPRGSP